ncbi:MAG TPA: signal peptidase I [Marinilabiliaceae bacterium]|jgi:signal peptidase I|nr:signal peptidase I [Marinilabiliaceae bacterium]HBX87067.1 signal peptidase I [Marinilabiliaceae bacterium]
MSQLSPDNYRLILEELLLKKNPVKVSVRGMSMFPMLMKDDLVIVSPTNYQELKKGDIVVFEKNDTLVAHRLLDKQDGFLLTRGDGNRCADQALAYEKVKGKVSQVVKSRWKIAKYATRKPGRILAYTGTLTGPLFWASGIIAYKLVLLFRRLKTHNP